MASMGLPARRDLLSHAVAVVASIIGGAFVALAAGTLGAGRLPVAASATVCVLVALASTALFWRHQARRWHAPSRPSGRCSHPQPRRATSRRIAGHMPSPKAERN